MKRLIEIIALWLLIVLCVSVGPAVAIFAPDAKQAPEKIGPPRPELDLTGTYRIKGATPGGREYGGLVMLRRDEGVYRACWAFETGAVASGTGLLRGSQLSVTSLGLDGPPAVGVYRLEIGDDKSRKLVGEWVYLGTALVGKETLELVKKE